MIRRPALALTCLCALVPVSCRLAPQGQRVLDVRPADSRWSADNPAELVALTPAATPTFPTLELHQRGRLDLQLTKGWGTEDASAPGFWREGAVRFWVGHPRPLRLRARARIVNSRGDTSARLGVGIGAQPVGEAEVTLDPTDVVFDLPAEAVRAGTNLLFLWREGRGRVTFDELVLEDAEVPRAEPAARVDLMAEGEPGPLRGLEVDRVGPLAFLLDPPKTPLDLELGIYCQQEPPTDRPRFRVSVEGDGRRGLLLEGGASPGRLQRHRVSLGDFVGAPVRLTLELAELPEGARCAWVEPRLVAPDSGRVTEPRSTPRARGANIILVVLDAASRDRFGLYGSTRGTTTVIDRLAGESLVLDRAVAQASYTLASTASLFTGHLPPTHGVTRSAARGSTPSLPAALPTFAEALSDAGYTTAMFTGNPNSVRFDLSRGFRELRELYLAPAGEVAVATQFLDPIREWLSPPPAEPYFLYVHYVQPHEPYDAAPEEFYQGLSPDYQGVFDGSRTTLLPLFRDELEADATDVAHLQGLYEGNLRYADWALGELIRTLGAAGALESSVFVVTADHGESLGERGQFGHGYNVHRETVPIPLLIRFPGRSGLAGRRDIPMGSVDLMPTLLDFVGVAPPSGTWGSSHLAQLVDPDTARWRRPLPSWAGDDRAATVAVYGADSKYTFDNRSNRESLFTFEEQENGRDNQAERPVTFDYLAFASFAPNARETLGEPAESEGVDTQTLEALRALGYVE